jgi:hypothetical protein
MSSAAQGSDAASFRSLKHHQTNHAQRRVRFVGASASFAAYPTRHCRRPYVEDPVTPSTRMTQVRLRALLSHAVRLSARRSGVWRSAYVLCTGF